MSSDAISSRSEYHHFPFTFTSHPVPFRLARVGGPLLSLSRRFLRVLAASRAKVGLPAERHRHSVCTMAAAAAASGIGAGASVSLPALGGRPAMPLDSALLASFSSSDNSLLKFIEQGIEAMKATPATMAAGLLYVRSSTSFSPTCSYAWERPCDFVQQRTSAPPRRRGFAWFIKPAHMTLIAIEMHDCKCYAR